MQYQGHVIYYITRYQSIRRKLPTEYVGSHMIRLRPQYLDPKPFIFVFNIFKSTFSLFYHHISEIIWAMDLSNNHHMIEPRLPRCHQSTSTLLGNLITSIASVIYLPLYYLSNSHLAIYWSIKELCILVIGCSRSRPSLRTLSLIITQL